MNVTENHKNTTHINIKQSLELLIKSAAVILLVFGALYGLNAAMTAFIVEEQAEQRAIEEERRLMQEDYDRANAYYPIIDHYDGQFQEIYEKRVNADYIFIGTSHITHGVTPEELEKSGKKFFNFALNGSTPSYYVWWYNDVFKPNHYVKPKAIIFGVDWFMFDRNWLWRRPDFDYKYLRTVSAAPASDDSNGVDSPETLETYETQSPPAYKYQGKWYDIDAIVTYITNRFAVFSSRTRFIELVLPEKSGKSENQEDIENTEFVPEKKEQEAREPILNAEGMRLDLFYKGYVPYQADFNGNSAGRVRTAYFAEEKEAFVSLVEQFQTEGIPVIFVMAPEYLPGREAPQFDELTDEIELFAIQKGITFLNYNRELVSDINYDHEYYSDWGHLNDNGAHTFSKKLCADLREILDFE